MFKVKVLSFLCVLVLYPLSVIDFFTIFNFMLSKIPADVHLMISNFKIKKLDSE